MFFGIEAYRIAVEETRVFHGSALGERSILEVRWRPSTKWKGFFWKKSKIVRLLGDPAYDIYLSTRVETCQRLLLEFLFQTCWRFEKRLSFMESFEFFGVTKSVFKIQI